MRTADAADEFWRKVMGETYRDIPQGADLTGIEKAALIPLREAWQAGPTQENRWHAAVSERVGWREVVRPLTVERLDAYLLEFERTGKSTIFSMPPADAERERWAAEDRLDDEAKR